MQKQEVYIYHAIRSPIGSFLGQFSNTSSVEITSQLIKNYYNKYPNIKIDHVILGQVLTCGLGQNTARQALIKGGGNYNIPAFTINHVCGSGLKSTIVALQMIISGEANNILAGGQENMSLTNHYIYARMQKKYGNYIIDANTKLDDKMFELKDSMIVDGLTDVFNNVLMAQTAEHLAKKYNITREEQDEFAFNSHQKAYKATLNGNFLNEICNIIVNDNIINKDESIRANTTIEKLNILKPLIANENNNSTESVTAGNSSSLNDGSSIIGIANSVFLKENNISPLVKIVSYATIGLDPMDMGLGPVLAIKTALKNANWALKSVDLFEINEAFAVQILACIKELQIPENIVNINGGAISLGHPIGASGARILTTLIYNMKRLNKKRGVASLCIGGGMGIAICIENCLNLNL